MRSRRWLSGWCGGTEESKGHGEERKNMLDLLMAAFTAAFFVVALGYIKACEHLK
jgi:hypothetical protein